MVHLYNGMLHSQKMKSSPLRQHGWTWGLEDWMKEVKGLILKTYIHNRQQWSESQRERGEMRVGRDFVCADGCRMQCADGVLSSCTLQTCMVL